MTNERELTKEETDQIGSAIAKTLKSVGCGCAFNGCFPVVIFILLFTTIFFGLPTPKGKFNLDFFPPSIWDMEQHQTNPAKTNRDK